MENIRLKEWQIPCPLPKGFYIETDIDIGKYNDIDNVYFYLKKINQKFIIGELLFRYRLGYEYSTHSDLREEYCNKGLGISLYVAGINAIIQSGNRVVSDTVQSIHSRRLWQGRTIRKYFNIKTEMLTNNCRRCANCFCSRYVVMGEKLNVDR